MRAQPLSPQAFHELLEAQWLARRELQDQHSLQAAEALAQLAQVQRVWGTRGWHLRGQAGRPGAGAGGERAGAPRGERCCWRSPWGAEVGVDGGPEAVEGVPGRWACECALQRARVCDQDSCVCVCTCVTARARHQVTRVCAREVTCVCARVFLCVHTRSGCARASCLGACACMCVRVSGSHVEGTVCASFGTEPVCCPHACPHV